MVAPWKSGTRPLQPICNSGVANNNLSEPCDISRSKQYPDVCLPSINAVDQRRLLYAKIFSSAF